MHDHRGLQGDDPFDFRNRLAEAQVDALLERRRRTRTAAASALQTYLNGVILIGSHKLDIAAVTFQIRSDSVNYILDLVFEGLFVAVWSTAALFTHKKSPVFNL